MPDADIDTGVIGLRPGETSAEETSMIGNIRFPPNALPPYAGAAALPPFGARRHAGLGAGRGRAGRVVRKTPGEQLPGY